jgi:hypothetical protein
MNYNEILSLNVTNTLIHNLAYDAAKDEAFQKEMFDDEDELRWIGDALTIHFHPEFEPIYIRHLQYFQSMFSKFYVDDDKVIL